jgi:hypothetical protein
VKILHTVDARVGRRCRVVRIDEVIGRLGSAAGPDFCVAVRAQGVVLLRLGLALTDLVRFVQRRRGRTASAHLSVPVAIRLQSDGIGIHKTGTRRANRRRTVAREAGLVRAEPLPRIVTLSRASRTMGRWGWRGRREEGGREKGRVSVSRRINNSSRRD